MLLDGHSRLVCPKCLQLMNFAERANGGRIAVFGCDRCDTEERLPLIDLARAAPTRGPPQAAA